MKPNSLPLLALCAMLLLPGLANAQSDEPSTGSVPPARETIELARVDVTRAERQSIGSDVRIAGSLAPAVRSVLTSKVSATIQEMPFEIGDVVKKGDLLVRFDKVALESALTAKEAELDALQAQLSFAESTLQRNTSLGDRGVASEVTRLESEANVLNFRAQIRTKQAQIDDSRRAVEDAVVTAPFDGVIAERPVAQGQTVPVNTELMTLVDLKRMEVDAGVPTSRIPLIEVGQPVELSVEGFPGRTFPAKVARISPTAVPGSRSIRVFLSISNEDQLLKGGMFTTGILRVDEQANVIAMPGPAIRHDGQGTFVLKVEDGALRRQAVTLGTSWTDRNLVEVMGLNEGDVVVTAPLADLVANTPVTVDGL